MANVRKRSNNSFSSPFSYALKTLLYCLSKPFGELGTSDWEFCWPRAGRTSRSNNSATSLKRIITTPKTSTVRAARVGTGADTLGPDKHLSEKDLTDPHCPVTRNNQDLGVAVQPVYWRCSTSLPLGVHQFQDFHSCHKITSTAAVTASRIRMLYPTLNNTGIFHLFATKSASTKTTMVSGKVISQPC
jgi:hypothetical protein